jgi:hypothetical protein
MHVWIFNGSKGKFPGGVFTDLEKAKLWIRKNALTGVLTRFPLDVGSYEWADSQGIISLALKEKATPEFIASFSNAGFEHFHFEDGDLA